MTNYKAVMTKYVGLGSPPDFFAPPPTLLVAF